MVAGGKYFHRWQTQPLHRRLVGTPHNILLCVSLDKPFRCRDNVFMNKLRLCFVALLALVAATSFAGCGGDDRLDHGTVTAKHHYDAYDSEESMMIQTSSVCSGSGTSQICTPIYSSFPYSVHHGEAWVLDLVDGKKKGVAYVTAALYSDSPVGSYFDSREHKGDVSGSRHVTKTRISK